MTATTRTATTATTARTAPAAPHRLRRSIAAFAVATAGVIGAGAAATPASAARLYTSTVSIANTGNASASIELYRWTSSGWVVEKSGTTAASGAATFRSVRGDAYYAWGTSRGAAGYDAAGNVRACAFYSRSNPNGQYVPAGVGRTVAFYQAWNTCGV